MRLSNDDMAIAAVGPVSCTNRQSDCAKYVFKKFNEPPLFSYVFYFCSTTYLYVVSMLCTYNVLYSILYVREQESRERNTQIDSAMIWCWRCTQNVMSYSTRTRKNTKNSNWKIMALGEQEMNIGNMEEVVWLK